MSNYSRQYTSGINWQNFTNTSTPLSAGNLNRMDNAIMNVDRAVEVAVNSKADSSTVNQTVKGVSYDPETGTFTFTFVNDTTVTVNTVLEKVVTNFTYDPETQRLILTLADGSVQYIDMSALITQYEFTDSATIVWTIGSGSGGKNKLQLTAVSATVGGINYTVNPDGTITANGIASIDSVFPLSAAFEITEQSVLSGCPDGGGAETYEIQYGTYSDTGSSVIIPSGETGTPSIVIRSGAEAANLIFRPMIAAKAVYDVSPDFVPYLGTGAVYASVKKGSITGEYLEPDYLARVTAQMQTAQGYAQSAATDADRAKDAADAAEGYRDEVRDAVQDFTGATTLSDGKHGLVPKPLQSANPEKKVLRSDGTWGEVESVPNGGATGQVLAKHSNSDGDTEWINPGHEILNASGTAMARRQKLQFTGAITLTDDATNDKTILNMDATAGVTSFNSRTGSVTPASGDYNAAQITRGSSNVNADLTAIEGRLTTYKDITVSTTAENYTYQGITYTRKHAISWSGATTADIFDGVITSGTYTDDWGIENDTAGTVNLRFASTPSGTLKIRVFKTKGVAG